MAEDSDRSYEVELDDSDSINTNSSNELDDEEPGEDVQQAEKEKSKIKDAINKQPKRVSYDVMPKMKSFMKVNLDGKFTGYVRCNKCTDEVYLMKKGGTRIPHLHGHIARFHKQDPDYYDSNDDQEKEKLYEIMKSQSNRIVLQAPPSNNNYLKGYSRVLLDDKFTNYFKCLLCSTMNLIKSDGDPVEGRKNLKKHQRRAHSGKRRNGADKSAKKSGMKPDDDVDSIGSNVYNLGNGDNGSIKTNGGNIGINQPGENAKLVEKAVIEDAIKNDPERVRYESAGTPRLRSFKKVYLEDKFTGFMKCSQCRDKPILIRKQGESTEAFERHISLIHDSKTPKPVQSKTNGPPIVTQPHEDSSSSSEEEQTTAISPKKPRTRDAPKKYPVPLFTQAESSSSSEDEEPVEPITMGKVIADAPPQIEQRQPEPLAVERPSTSRKRGRQSRSEQPSTSSKRGNETDDDYDNLIKQLTPRTKEGARKYPVREAESSSSSEDEEPAEPITLGIATANAPPQVEQRQPEPIAVEQPSTSRKRGHQSRSGDQPSTSSRKRGNETDDDNLINKLKVKKLQLKIKESELMIQKEELLIEEKRLKIDHYKKVDQGFSDIVRAAKVIISLGSDGLREQLTDHGHRKSTSK